MSLRTESCTPSLFSAAHHRSAITPSHAQDYPTRAGRDDRPVRGRRRHRRCWRGSSATGSPSVSASRSSCSTVPAPTPISARLAAVRAKPDGYTLLIASVGLAANPSLYKKLAFEPQSDLEPITLIANSPTVLAVPPSLPVNTLAEFIAYAKARPGELNYASYGVGSGPHLATELFQGKTGVKMVHVPYGGGGPAAVGVMTNQVQALFSSVLPVLGMIRGGNAQGDRHRRRPPLRAPSGRADLRGERARLPHRHLVRAARARPRRRPRSSTRCTAPACRCCRTRACARRSSSRAPRWSRTRRPSSAPSSRTRPSGWRRDPRREHSTGIQISRRVGKRRAPHSPNSKTRECAVPTRWARRARSRSCWRLRACLRARP